MDLVDYINLMLKILTLTGLTAGLFFIAVQLLIRQFERQ